MRSTFLFLLLILNQANSHPMQANSIDALDIHLLSPADPHLYMMPGSTRQVSWRVTNNSNFPRNTLYLSTATLDLDQNYRITALNPDRCGTPVYDSTDIGYPEPSIFRIALPEGIDPQQSLDCDFQIERLSSADQDLRLGLGYECASFGLICSKFVYAGTLPDFSVDFEPLALSQKGDSYADVQVTFSNPSDATISRVDQAACQTNVLAPFWLESLDPEQCYAGTAVNAICFAVGPGALGISFENIPPHSDVSCPVRLHFYEPLNQHAGFSFYRTNLSINDRYFHDPNTANDNLALEIHAGTSAYPVPFSGWAWTVLIISMIISWKRYQQKL